MDQEQDITKRQKKVEQFCKQTNLLLTQFAKDVTQVKILWECQFNLLKKFGFTDKSVLLPKPFDQLKLCNQNLLAFLSGPKLRPFNKIIIRDALSAALSEAYALKYVKKPDDGKTCYVLDVSSLYPHIGIAFPMPQGKYFSISGDELAASAVTFDPDKAQMFLNGCEVFAVIHCRVYPPTNLVHPFLQTQVNGLTVGTLCRTCSEAASMNNNLQQCGHSDVDRSFVSTCSSHELAYASGLGYNFDFFEMIVYREASYFLRPFLTLLGFQKLRHSDYPREADTIEKQATYCQDVSKQMRFLEIIQMELTPECVRPNKDLRSFYKACLNFFIGTFGANAEKGSSVLFLEYYDQLIEHVKADNIVNLVPLTERILQVTCKNKEKTPSRSSNVSVAIAITSLARITVHKKMQEVVTIGGTILRVSCDEIFFILPTESILPFSIGEVFGSYKHHFSNVLSVVQLGLRNVSLVHLDKQGKRQEVLITSGVMQSQYNCSLLSHSLYLAKVDELLENNKQVTVIPKVINVNFVNSLKKRNLISVQKEQSALNYALYLRRQFCDSIEYRGSLPYGFVT